MKLRNFLAAALACSLSVSAIADHHGEAEPAYKVPNPVIDETLNLTSKTIKVLGSDMAYLELGTGEPIIFVHGNPTSSYLWRNILPHVEDKGRAIAVDLIGMGNSSKPNINYTFEDHFTYFSAFVDALNVNAVTLVGHDWGAAIAWEYARQNPNKVKQLAFMEGVLPPAFPVPSFESMGEEMGNMFRAFKDPVKGKELVIDNNMFVEQVLPGFVSRPLGEQAMNSYRAPYKKASTRKPLLEWPRQVPIAGEPASTQQAMENIGKFMQNTDMPVLLLYASPGVLVPPQAVPWYVQTIKNLETSFIGNGLHFVQEDQPEAIGRSLNDWLRRTTK